MTPRPPKQSETDVPAAVRVPPEPRPLSRPVRGLLWLAGTIALGLGMVGVVLPGLPTTPFILLEMLVLALLIAFPILATFLPRLFD